MHGRYERTSLIVFAGLGSLGRGPGGGAARALCTETGLLLGLALPTVPVPRGVPRVTHLGTTLVLRVVLVLVMVRRRCIHTAFKPSSGGNTMKEKTKKRKGTGKAQDEGK